MSAELKTEYAKLQPSGHWFDRSSMRFFSTRFGAEHWLDKYVLFITSEKPPHRKRAYTVRRMDRITGDVATAGPFCTLSRYAAKQWLAELALKGGDI